METTAKKFEKPKIKSIDGKPLILVGLVDKIEYSGERFNQHNWRIKMNGFVYYYNSISFNSAEKLFTEGEKTAFTVRESPNKRNPEQPFLVISQVFWTF